MKVLKSNYFATQLKESLGIPENARKIVITIEADSLVIVEIERFVSAAEGEELVNTLTQYYLTECPTP